MNLSVAHQSTSNLNRSNLYDLFEYKNQKSGKSDDTAYEIIISKLIGDKRLENYLKDFIEGIIYKQWTMDLIANYMIQDDPFDSIYLADLKPDEIRSFDMTLLDKLARKIVDKFGLTTLDKLDENPEIVKNIKLICTSYIKI